MSQNGIKPRKDLLKHSINQYLPTMKKVLIWCSEIHLINGFFRSILIDCQRGDFKLVPNNFEKLKTTIHGKTIEELEKILSADEYNWLLECYSKEYILEIPEKYISNFPQISTTWEHPSHITNAVVHYQNDFLKILDFLKTILCHSVHIIFENEQDFIGFITSLYDSDLRSIEVSIHSQQSKDFDINTYFKKYPIIKNFTVIKNVKNRNNFDGFLPTFGNNFDIYKESQLHNVYFNRKIYITRDLEIKNAIETKSTFGNIEDVNIFELLNNQDFKKYWSSNKSDTDICKDCEFRNICLDNRVPIHRKINEWYHESECQYNPYIAKWQGEEGYKSLNECGVFSNENGFQIDHQKINEINKHLWEDEIVTE